MTQLLILILAAVMIAAAKTKSYAKKVYTQATYKVAEMNKKQGGKNE